jgi:hypothetical protein
MSEKSERDSTTFQSYLDNIKAKTGKTPADFRKLAANKNFQKVGEAIAWLKADYGLGHGHANLIAQMILNPDMKKRDSTDALADHFKGEKAGWRKAYDGLAEKLQKFGADVEIAPNRTYVNLCRGIKKFGIVQISAADRIDIGIKLKGVAPNGRLELAGSWNAMVTHRVKIGDAKQIDKEVLAWLKQAYDAAK